jgi:thioester reductase-like protein
VVVPVSVLLTGFPGFLGEALVERLVTRGRSVTCLVQPRYREVADRRRRAIREGVDGDGTITLVEGDLTHPQCGLDSYDGIAEATTEVFHLAAIYDLGVDRATAQAVNVRGTERVLDLAEAADVERVQYVSTCYVSGRYDGPFGADDLDVGQSFNNQYEASKFAAEVVVQERMAAGLPATIYRPAIVTGDSQTGETRKYDGLYYLLRLVQRQPGVALAPVGPRPRGHELNVVPRDYVVAAIDHLAARADTVGGVYQLCDPSPPSIDELVHLLGAATDTQVIPVPLPGRVLKAPLERSGALRGWLDLEPEAVDYLSHPTTYRTATTREALADTDIACPPLDAYVSTLAEFASEHPDLDDSPMA